MCCSFLLFSILVFIYSCFLASNFPLYQVSLLMMTLLLSRGPWNVLNKSSLRIQKVFTSLSSSSSVFHSFCFLLISVCQILLWSCLSCWDKTRQISIVFYFRCFHTFRMILRQFRFCQTLLLQMIRFFLVSLIETTTLVSTFS